MGVNVGGRRGGDRQGGVLADQFGGELTVIQPQSWVRTHLLKQLGGMDEEDEKNKTEDHLDDWSY